MLIPDTPPRLLPGRTAYGWASITVKSAVVGTPMVVLIVVAALLPEGLREIVQPAAAVVGLVAVAILIWAGLGQGRAELAEIAAGYTTLYHQNRELWQLDPKTGEVLRRPGEPKAVQRA